MLYSHPGHPSLKSEHIFRQGTLGEADHIEDLVLRTIER